MGTVIDYVARLVAFNYTTRKVTNTHGLIHTSPVHAALKLREEKSVFEVKCLHGLLAHCPWTDLRIIHYSTIYCICKLNKLQPGSVTERIFLWITALYFPFRCHSFVVGNYTPQIYMICTMD